MSMTTTQVICYQHTSSTSNKETYLPRLSRNSEALASEILGNLEKMFILYYQHSDAYSRSKENH